MPTKMLSALGRYQGEGRLRREGERGMLLSTTAQTNIVDVALTKARRVIGDLDERQRRPFQILKHEAVRVIGGRCPPTG